MRKRISVSEKAKEELKAAIEYIKRDKPGATENFKNNIIVLIENLSDYPLAHTECRLLPSKNKIYRNAIFGNYLIIYKILPDEIEVLSIFHSSRNPKEIKKLKTKK